MQALKFHGVPRCIIKAIVSEWEHQCQFFRWEGACSKVVPRQRGLPQGDPLPPLVCNLVMNFLSVPLMEKWSSANYGVSVGDAGALPTTKALLFIFADDLVLIAKDPEQLRNMHYDLEATLGPFGLRLDSRKSEWTHSLAVVFSGILEKVNTVNELRAQVADDLRSLYARACGLLKEMAKSNEHLQECTVVSGNPNGDLEMLNLLDVDFCKQELNDIKGRMREAERLLGDGDKEVYPPSFTIFVVGQPIKYKPGHQAMLLLGSMISGSGKTQADTDHRISKAWGAFWLNKDKLLCREVDPAIRLRALNAFVGTTLLYGSASWTPTKSELQRVHTTHMKMSRLILGSKHVPGEQYHEYLIRTAARIKTLQQSSNILPWDVAVLYNIHAWAGHVARYTTYRPARWSALAYLQ